MKTKFFLVAGLLVTAFGFSQTTTYYPAPTGTYPSGAAGTGGAKSVHIGNLAGSNAVTGTGDSQSAWNVFVGEQAGQYNEIGDSNIYVGGHAGENSTTGSNNVYIGQKAGYLSDGDFSVIIGSNAGISTTIGYNTMIGAGAGQFTTTQGNTMLGNFAGRANVGGNNILLGSNAGGGEVVGGTPVSSPTGSHNIFLGNYTGVSMSTGHDNVFIGNNIGSDVTKVHPTTSNKLYIDNSNVAAPLIYGDFDSSRELKFNAKKVGIGHDTNGEFGDFPTLSFSNAGIYRFFVRGGILAEEVRIRSYANWADYVFTDNYKLMPLNELEKYIADNGHLPNMPSAKEVEEEGLELGNIVKLQQEKIEELTLHLIQQQKEIERLKNQNKRIEILEARNVEIDELKAQIKILLNKK